MSHRSHQRRQFTLTPDTITEITNLRYKLLSDRNELYDYLTEATELQYDNIDSNGKALPINEIVIPPEIIHPAPFSLALYPLNDDRSNFKPDHLYDYLYNFSYDTLQSKEGFDEVEVKLISALRELVEKKNCQPRFSNIWRQLLAVVWTLDTIYQNKGYPLRHYIKPLFGYVKREFKFYQNSGAFVFNDKSASVILPLLTYMLMNVGTRICTGRLTHAESIIAINGYLRMATTSYVDNKLKMKGPMRNWIREGFNKIGQAYVPMWTNFLTLSGVELKNLREPSFINDEIKENADKRKVLLQIHNDYIRHCLNHVKTIEELRKYYSVCRAFSNDGTYLATLTELSLDAAVQPKIRKTIVSKPKPMLVDRELQNALQVYEDGPFYDASRYMNGFVDTIITENPPAMFDERWINFVSISSPGRKLEEAAIRQLHPFIRDKLLKTRVTMEAVQSGEYRQIKRYIEGLALPINLVERIQIDRRQRAIAGLPNERLFLSFPPYSLGKEIYKYSDAVAQGKQLGNVYDIASMLYLTTQKGAVHSSIDITGMDASVQPLTKELYNTTILLLASKLSEQHYGPFVTRMMQMRDSNGAINQTEVNAIWQAVMYEIKTTQTATTYNSKIFGPIKAAEGTYPSGRADTSTHHTILLLSIIRGNQCRRAREQKPSSVVDLKVMGDDLRITYVGSEDVIAENIQEDAEILNSAGFETTGETSINYVTLLQQMVANGVYWGFDDRISLWTRETEKGRTYLADSAQELMALVDDMMSRVEELDGLHLIAFAIMVFCIGRYTLRVGTSQLKTINEKLSQRLQTTTYTHVNKEGTSEQSLITIYAPIMWCFMHKGGELPHFEMIDCDGIVIPRSSLYTARGESLRRVIYLLSGMKQQILKGCLSVHLNNEWLEIYGVHSAELFHSLQLISKRHELREEAVPADTIRELGESLESVGDMRGRTRSIMAAVRLADKGIKVDRSLIYGFNIQERILQAARSAEIGDEYEVEFSDYMFNKLKSLDVMNVKFSYQRDDIKHMYVVVENGIRVDYNSNINTLGNENICIGAGLQIGTDSWALLNIIGFPDRAVGIMKAQFAAIRGSYHKYGFDDPAFLKGVEIYSSNDPSSMAEYFDVINASVADRVIMLKAFEYYKRYKRYRYGYVLSPRQLFWLNDNPASIQHLIGDETMLSANPLVQSMFMIYVYLHLLAYIGDYRLEQLEVKCARRLLSYINVPLGTEEEVESMEALFG